MGLRCLLGHDFGEPELEREREEQGSEVVITVREVKTCTRCGNKQVVSENKEVTTVEQLAATATADADDEAESGWGETPDEGFAAADSAAGERDSEPFAAQADPSEGPAGPAESTGTADVGVTIGNEPTTEDAEVLSDEPDIENPDDAIVEAQSDDAASDDAGVKETVTDDGIILPNDEPAGDSDRRPGEWPDYEEQADDELANPTPWPEQEGEDEGFDAADPSAGGPDEVSFGGGFTPEYSDGSSSEFSGGSSSEFSGNSSPSDTEAAFDDDSGFARADRAAEFEPTVDDVETEFFCPACGLTRVAGTSSMRAGDICPECRRGYISEQPL